MSQQPYATTTAPQPTPTGGYPGQHDTTALPRAPHGSPGDGPENPAGLWYAPVNAPINPEAAAWQERFRQQRTRTRIAVAFAALASVAALVLGVATWQLANTPVLGAASGIASAPGSGSADSNPNELLPGGTAPGDGLPQDGQPDSIGPGNDVPISELPLPDSLKSLAAGLGITDVGQLLDLAVANGIMDQAGADQLLAAIAGGAAAGSTQ